jgi:hypothetical protein
LLCMFRVLVPRNSDPSRSIFSQATICSSGTPLWAEQPRHVGSGFHPHSHVCMTPDSRCVAHGAQAATCCSNPQHAQGLWRCLQGESQSCFLPRAGSAPALTGTPIECNVQGETCWMVLCMSVTCTESCFRWSWVRKLLFIWLLRSLQCRAYKDCFCADQKKLGHNFFVPCNSKMGG